jgi:precorrin-3B synthase
MKDDRVTEVREETGAIARARPPARVIDTNGLGNARGACPSLAAPMMTGDGLLVRLRPAVAGLTFTQVRELAKAAAVNGNGIIEITARGNLQLRGLTRETMRPLSQAIVDADLAPDAGVAIETPPLSGIDPEEIASARDMAASIRAAIAGLAPISLAPKLSIIVDGGGQHSLDTLTADIRVKASRLADGRVQWSVSVADSVGNARFLRRMSAPSVPPIMLELLKALANKGKNARGRDLTDADLSDLFPLEADPMGVEITEQTTFGIGRVASGELVLRLRLRFGQVHARELSAFADLAERHGAREIRLAPDHCVLLIGLTGEAATAVELAAANFGLSSDPADPARRIAACAGAGACASGRYRTKAAASEFVAANAGLLDGSIDVHFSGCPKGCAHARSAAITVVGTPTGYGLVVNGVASSEPVTYIGRNALNRALTAVGQLVHDKKGAGESVDACLKRLSAADIVTALRQG